jgi:predicted RNA polymerase sigma factor
MGQPQRGRQRSSRFFAGLARNALGFLPKARVAVHPGDVTVPALISSIHATYAAFAHGRRIARYADLLDSAHTAPRSERSRGVNGSAMVMIRPAIFPMFPASFHALAEGPA